MTDSSEQKKRGFATISPERQKEIARMGGLAAHRNGTAHEWDSEQARVAGRLGGLRSKGPSKKIRKVYAVTQEQDVHVANEVIAIFSTNELAMAYKESKGNHGYDIEEFVIDAEVKND